MTTDAPPGPGENGNPLVYEAGSDHQHLLAAADLCGGYSFRADGHRLCQRRDVHVEALWHDMAVAVGHVHEICECAVASDTNPFAAAAIVVVVRNAGRAFAAGDRGARCNPYSHGVLRDARPHAFNRACKFVAERDGHRTLHRLVSRRPFRDVKVGAADPRRMHPDQDLTRLQDRFIRRTKFQPLGRKGLLQCKHLAISRWSWRGYYPRQLRKCFSIRPMTKLTIKPSTDRIVTPAKSFSRS